MEVVEPCRAEDVGDCHRVSPPPPPAAAGVGLRLCLSEEQLGIEVEKEDKEDY